MGKLGRLCLRMMPLWIDTQRVSAEMALPEFYIKSARRRFLAIRVITLGLAPNALLAQLRW